MSDVRAITVRQPWAWAIAHGGKELCVPLRPASAPQGFGEDGPGFRVVVR